MQIPSSDRGKFSARVLRGLTGSDRVWLLALALILAMTTAVRIRLLDMPLERDEGEYAYGGQLLLQGVPPYAALYTMKWPGTHAAYALIMAVFGQTIGGIRTGLILLSLATAALMFLLGKRVCGGVAGASVAAAVYAVLAIGLPTCGLAAHATHFVLLPALGGLLLLHTPDSNLSRVRLVLAGLLLGLAAVMKQPGAAFWLFAALWLGWREWKLPDRNGRRLGIRLGWLALGGFLPVCLMCLGLLLGGVLDRFWFWTVVYARAYGSLRTVADGVPSFLEIVRYLFKAAPGLWGLAALGFVLLWLHKPARAARAFLAGLLCFSFLAVCPGWYFRGHYFLLMLPAAGLLAGVAVEAARDRLGRIQRGPVVTTVLALGFGGLVAWTFAGSRAPWFELTPQQVSRIYYGPSFFPESVEIGAQLAAHSPPDARIAVLGSEPQIYFYSRRRSATGHIYMYPLMEPQPYAVAMQKEMIEELNRARPDYVVFFYSQYSWLQRQDSPNLLFDWFNQYRRANLEFVARADLLPDLQTVEWSRAETPAAALPQYWVGIYRRRPAPAEAPPRAAGQ